MDDELSKCNVCGADAAIPGGGGGGVPQTPLDQHIADHDDPHHTLALVPNVYVGNGPPTPESGYKAKDWYIDSVARVIYTCVSENVGSDVEIRWVPASIAEAVTEPRLASVLASYVTSSRFESVVSGLLTIEAASVFVTGSQLDSRGFVTSPDLLSVLTAYATKDYVSGLGYLTSGDLSGVLSAYVTTSGLSSALLSYYDRETSDARYALAGSYDDRITAAQLNSRLSEGFVFRRPSEGTYPELDLDRILAGYLTSEAAGSTYLTAESARATYATTSFVASAVAGLVSQGGMATALSAYLTKSEASSTYVTQDAADARYVRPSTIAQYLTGLVTDAGLAAALSSYYTKTDADGRFALSSSLSSYALKSYVDGIAAGLVTDGALTTALSAYLTKSEASSTYMSQSVADARYIRPSTLVQYLTAYVTDTALSSALSGYYTKSESDERFAPASAVASLVTPAQLESVLSTYATNAALAAALVPYITAAAARAEFVTPAYLVSGGYLTQASSFFSSFVRTSGTVTSIESILASWPVSEVTALSLRPPTSAAVRTQVDRLDGRIDTLASEVAGIVVTSGVASRLVKITSTVTVSGNRYMRLTDNACNYISASEAETLVGGYDLGIRMPTSPGDGVARDFLLAIRFDGSAGQVRNHLVLYPESSSYKCSFWSHSRNPFSLDGVTSGATVIWGFTEIGKNQTSPRHVFAVTRKVVYHSEDH